LFLFLGADSAYFEADGFTELKGATPVYNAGRKSKGTVTVSNRLIAVIVTCGGIDTQFLYSTDELVRGGANCMIEVMRQSFSDLGVILGERGQSLPRKLYLQFDNCGENKNRFILLLLLLLLLLILFI